jgi:class 3 adenylate cyclase
MSQDVAARHYEEFIPELDITAELPQVRAQTLVLHFRKMGLTPVEASKAVATSIPDARFVLVDGGYDAWFDRFDDLVRPFLDEGHPRGRAAQIHEAGAFRTILFTDVEGSTALTDRLGDAKARELLREHERMVREALKAHGGSEVKALGDGFMTSFFSATKALECAIAVQRAFAERNASSEEPILVRVGLNAGEPIAEGDDLYGTAVNLAARITAQGKGGEILASEAVRQIVAGKKFPFSDLGETTLRGIEDRVHIYQVSWREDG